MGLTRWNERVGTFWVWDALEDGAYVMDTMSYDARECHVSPMAVGSRVFETVGRMARPKAAGGILSERGWTGGSVTAVMK